MLAAWRIRSALPTEVPPNFITVRLMDSYVGRELVTLVVQHAEAKSGKRVTVSLLTSDVTAGHTALARRGQTPSSARRSEAPLHRRCLRRVRLRSGMHKKVRTSPLQMRAGPELNGQVPVYCWPMIFPL